MAFATLLQHCLFPIVNIILYPILKNLIFYIHFETEIFLPELIVVYVQQKVDNSILALFDINIFMGELQLSTVYLIKINNFDSFNL